MTEQGDRVLEILAEEKPPSSAISEWPRAPTRADGNVDRLADLIRHRIFTRELLPGTRLPAERTLSARLDVSRNTLRAALAKLQAEGLLTVRQGRGVTVSDYREAGSLALVQKMPAEMQDDILPEILELRSTLAVSAAVKAALHASDEQLDELGALAKQIQDCRGLEDLVRLDLQFSRMLVRAARSIPLELLLNPVATLLQGRPDISDAIFHDRSDVRRSYEVIVELLRGRDREAISELMRQGLEGRDRKTIELLEKTKKPKGHGGSR